MSNEQNDELGLTPEGKEALKFRVFHASSVSKDLNEMLDKLQNETAEAQLSKAKSIYEADKIKAVEEAKREEKESIISQIEAMDKRHSISFVLQALNKGVK